MLYPLYSDLFLSCLKVMTYFAISLHVGVTLFAPLEKNSLDKPKFVEWQQMSFAQLIVDGWVDRRMNK